MNRRGFLGSIIGAVMGADFLARAADEEWQRVVLPYRMLFRDGASGYTIQAPGVASVRPDARGGWTFVAEPLNVCRATVVDRMILLTEDGRVIHEGRFDQTCHMISGDTFKCTDHLSVTGIQGIGLEELIDLHIRKGGKVTCRRRSF